MQKLLLPKESKEYFLFLIGKAPLRPLAQNVFGILIITNTGLYQQLPSIERFRLYMKKELANIW
ncbi:hypothetical protein J22TS1_30690 [Siminovitchia terrae]|nr:hypothetical protein J22TS1_30690 [Siminovitchia terrae]